MKEDEPSYELEITLKALKYWKTLSNPIHRRINDKVKALAFDPRPMGYEKLEGIDGYRIRVGDYRVVYTIDDAVGLVTIVRISHRKNVYKRPR